MRSIRLFTFLSVTSVLLASSVNAESIDELIHGPIKPPSEQVRAETSAPFRGQFRSVNYAVLSAGIAAKVESFSAKTGTRVEKGQVIAEFDCSIPKVERKITLAKESAASQSLKVNQRLNALENISELELNLSVAELAIARAELERTKKILSECTIYAPFSGTVTEKLAQAHEYVNAGDPLIEIIDTDNIEIEMVLPSIYLKSYQKGTEFSMRVDETGQIAKAKVDRVVNVIDPVSQTVRIIGTLSGSTDGLMPGMSGQVIFNP